jgi:hypothetical protein
LGRALSLRGRPPWTPLAYCMLYLLRGQSSYRGFDRAFGKAFGRAFVELYMEVHVELLYAFVELLWSFCRAFAELLQSFDRALYRALVELRAEPYIEPHAGIRIGD